MKGNFMKAHSTPDYLGYIEKSTKQLKEQLEEVKKTYKRQKKKIYPLLSILIVINFLKCL